MRALIALVGAALVLTACDGAPTSGPDTSVGSPVSNGGGSTPPGDVPVPDMDRDACGAPGFQGWIGRPRADLPPKPADATWRIYKTGDALTEDYSTHRLNVEIDPATDRVVRVWCG